MGKIKTSRRQRTLSSKTRASRRKKRDDRFDVSLKEGAEAAKFDPSATLLDIKVIGAAIVQCLIENQPDEVVEIIEGHISCLNKSKFLKEADIPRSTMYRILRMKNPTIKTLAKIMYAAHHSQG